MLKRIHVRNYKSLVDVNLELKPLSVFFGPNSAGKSNFLDALQLLSRIGTKSTLKEAFESPYRGTPLESFNFADFGIKGLLGRDTAAFSIEVDVELSPAVIDTVNRQIKEMKRRGKSPTESEPVEPVAEKSSYVSRRHLRYRVDIEILPQSGILRVTNEYLAALTAEGEPRTSPRPFIEKIGDRIHLRMEGQAHPTYYESHVDHTILSRPLYPPHYPHITAMRQELASWFFFYFEPRERMRASNPVKEVRHVGLMGENLAAFLNTLKALDPEQFKSVERALRLFIPSVTGIQVQVNDLGEVELLLLEGGIAIPARVLSEGTLRLLGLLALEGAKEPPSLIGFEEPENGIHPRRIKAVAELLKTRAQTGNTQLVVTTHSPILLDQLPDSSLLVCQRDRGKTTISPFKTWGQLGRSRDIDQSLDEEPTPVSTRVLRGDFDV